MGKRLALGIAEPLERRWPRAPAVGHPAEHVVDQPSEREDVVEHARGLARVRFGGAQQRIRGNRKANR